MMNNETYLDFCFIRKSAGHFQSEINCLLQELFEGKQLNWYLEEKKENGSDIVIAEVKGMSSWTSQEETFAYLDTKGTAQFWKYLQGYQLHIYPAKGCGTCGSH